MVSWCLSRKQCSQPPSLSHFSNWPLRIWSAPDSGGARRHHYSVGPKRTWSHHSWYLGLLISAFGSSSTSSGACPISPSTHPQESRPFRLSWKWTDSKPPMQCTSWCRWVRLSSTCWIYPLLYHFGVGSLLGCRFPTSKQCISPGNDGASQDISDCKFWCFQ